MEKNKNGKEESKNREEKNPNPEEKSPNPEEKKSQTIPEITNRDYIQRLNTETTNRDYIQRLLSEITNKEGIDSFSNEKELSPQPNGSRDFSSDMVQATKNFKSEPERKNEKRTKKEIPSCPHQKS